MPDIFVQMIQRLQSIGAFNFIFPFMLTSAVFYGLLRKSQVFGKPAENVVVNGLVALVAAFMVWAYPILSGIDIEAQLSAFFMQGLIVTLVFMIGLMITSMFMPPNLPKELQNFLQGNKIGAVLVIAIIIGIAIFVTSGLLNLLIGPVLVGVPSDVVLAIVVLAVLILPLIFILRGEGKPVQPPEEKGKG